MFGLTTKNTLIFNTHNASVKKTPNHESTDQCFELKEKFSILLSI